MIGKKANGFGFWTILSIIIVVVSLVLIVAYYFGVIPKLSEVATAKIFGTMD